MRIQDHRISFATSVKESCLDGKEKATTRKKKIMKGKAHQ